MHPMLHQLRMHLEEKGRCSSCSSLASCPSWHKRVWLDSCPLFTPVKFLVIGVIEDKIYWIVDSPRAVIKYPFKTLIYVSKESFFPEDLLVAGRDLSFHVPDYEDTISYQNDSLLVLDLCRKYGFPTEPIATYEDILELRRIANGGE